MRKIDPVFKKDEDRLLDKSSATTLRNLREEFGMTQKELASALDMTPSYLCDIENGRRDLKLSVWMAALKVINERASKVESK